MAEGQVNQTLDRRREEKAAEQLLQESVSRTTELTSCAMEICQKNIAYGASMLRFWTDSLETVQASMGQVVQHTQKLADQARRV